VWTTAELVGLFDWSAARVADALAHIARGGLVHRRADVSWASLAAREAERLLKRWNPGPAHSNARGWKPRCE
jgi:hypothetical protein